MMYSIALSTAFLFGYLNSQSHQTIIDKFRFPLDRSGKPICSEPVVDKQGVYHFKSPGQKFVLDFESSEDKALVNKTIAAIQIAGGVIENAISLNKPVKVAINHGSYCKVGPVCQGGGGSLAQAGYYPKLSKDESGDLQEYPLTLYHERYPTRYTQGYCISMHVSDNKYAIYPDDYTKPKVPVLADIVSTIVHELFHGLGFSSTLRQVRNFTRSENGKYQLHIKHTMFDTHLQTKDTSIGQLLKDISTPTYSAKEAEQQAKQLNEHKSVKKIEGIKKNYENIYFKTSKRSKVYILNNSATTGSNLAHVDTWIYQSTIDYLMNHGFIPPILLRNLISKKDWLTAPIGPVTLEVMETLGYELNLHPSREKSLSALYEQLRDYKGSQI